MFGNDCSAEGRFRQLCGNELRSNADTTIETNVRCGCGGVGPVHGTRERQIAMRDLDHACERTTAAKGFRVNRFTTGTLKSVAIKTAVEVH